MTVDESLSNINPKNDYIAIWFKGGTGGKFLSTWLTNAKLMDTSFNMAAHGGCNDGYRELEHDFERPTLFAKHIEYVRTVRPKVETISPYFYTTGCWYPNSLADEVNKLIFIRYDLSDIDLIFQFYLSKNKGSVQTISDSELIHIYQAIKRMYVRVISKNTFPSNVFPIEFKDLVFSPPESLIHNLSEITGLKAENFNKEILTEWRERSLQGARNAESSLSDFYDRNPNIRDLT